MLQKNKVYRHPQHGLVLCTGGQYMGTYGVSNFWDFRKVLKNGKLGKALCDYGLNFTEVSAKVTTEISVRLINDDFEGDDNVLDN